MILSYAAFLEGLPVSREKIARAGQVAMTFHVPRDGQMRLKAIALGRELSLQSLLEEAVNLWLEDRGEKPIEFPPPPLRGGKAKQAKAAKS